MIIIAPLYIGKVKGVYRILSSAFNNIALTKCLSESSVSLKLPLEVSRQSATNA